MKPEIDKTWMGKKGVAYISEVLDLYIRLSAAPRLSLLLLPLFLLPHRPQPWLSQSILAFLGCICICMLHPPPFLLLQDRSEMRLTFQIAPTTGCCPVKPYSPVRHSDALLL